MILIVYGFILLMVNIRASCGCDLIIAKSSLPHAGRGVFAGRNYQQGEIVLTAPSLFVPSTRKLGNQIENYVFESGIDGYDFIALGYASLLNHANEPNVEHFWSHDDEILLDSNTSHHISPHHSVDFIALRYIRQGEEILTTYGGDEWFSARFGEGFVLASSTEATPLPIELIQAMNANDSCLGSGYCVNNAVTNNSKLPLAGKGLFSRRRFNVGDIISISPALVIPTEGWLIAIDSTVFVNYCIWQPGSSVALLPLGHAAMVNHKISEDANVVLEWGFPRDRTINSINQSRGVCAEVYVDWSVYETNRSFVDEAVGELSNSRFTLIDLALVATKNIETNDELTMDYGSAWLSAWADYLAQSLMVKTNYMHCRIGNIDDYLDSVAPELAAFRHPIIPPELNFPIHWL